MFSSGYMFKIQLTLSSPRWFKWGLRRTKAGAFLGWPFMSVCPRLRGFPGCRTFSANTGKELGKPGWVLTLVLFDSLNFLTSNFSFLIYNRVLINLWKEGQYPLTEWQQNCPCGSWWNFRDTLRTEGKILYFILFILPASCYSSFKRAVS